MALSTSAAAGRPALPAPTGRPGSLGLAQAPLSAALVGTDLAQVQARQEDNPLKTMNGIQKAAALLIALGPEASSTIFKHLNEADVEAVTVELFRMRQVSARV